MTLKNFFMAVSLAARPKTLTAAIVPIIVAAGLTSSYGIPVNGMLVLCALLSCVLIQIGTNFFNDMQDYEKGADSESRLGPLRVTQAGLLLPKTVYRLGTLAFFLATLFAIPLFLKGGLIIFLLFLLSLAAGYAYTGGPYPLAYQGLGELFVFVFFGLVITGAIFYVLSGFIAAQSLIAGAQIGSLACVLISINNLRDFQQDRIVKKKTLSVRFGLYFSRIEITAAIWLPFLLSLYWWFIGKPSAAFFPFLATPLAFKLTNYLWKYEPSALYNHFLVMAATLHLLFGLLLTLGFFLG